MRLYRIIGAAWAGTQADAKAAAKEASAPWHEFEVPTDKPGLLAFLNERNVRGSADEKFVAPADDELGDGSDYGVAPLVPTSPAEARPDYTRDFTASEIVDFILNRASVAQVENVFASIGTRFAEQRRAA